MSETHIYIIGHATAYKIGFSNDPNSRLLQLQTANRDKLTLLWSMKRKDAPQLEKYLHRKYKQHKIRGEWFKNDLLTVEQIIRESYCYAEYDW